MTKYKGDEIESIPDTPERVVGKQLRYRDLIAK